MRAEIISIGDELTSGNRLDTNSQWLSQQLGILGITTVFHTTIGDSLLDNVDAFRIAASRADIVISSGGLGPTADDLTREAISIAFNRPLEFRSEAFEHIEGLFKKRNREMPERNRVQAMFPEGSDIIPNPHGTAPGIDLSVIVNDRQSHIFALPGVPAEMKEMVDATVVKTLVQRLGAGKKRWYYRTLKVFGIGESDVEKLLPDLIARDRHPLVGITVSKATISLRIAALAESENEFIEQVDETEQIIHQKLGSLVYGTGEIELDEAVAELLDEKKLKLGVIEVGAGVWVAPALSKHQSTDPEFGLVAAKWHPMLAASKLMSGDVGAGPSEADLNKTLESRDNAVLLELEWMGRAMLEAEGLDLCLAVGSYPNVEDLEKESGTFASQFSMVLLRKVGPDGDVDVKSKQVTLGAHPEVLYHRLAKNALNLIRTELIEGE